MQARSALQYLVAQRNVGRGNQNPRRNVLEVAFEHPPVECGDGAAVALFANDFTFPVPGLMHLQHGVIERETSPKTNKARQRTMDNSVPFLRRPCRRSGSAAARAWAEARCKRTAR